MDLVTGLSAASQTLTIIKQIKALDLAIDDAAFKEKILELQESAFEARSALLEAKENALAKDEVIAALRQKLNAATSGEACPLCEIGVLKTKSVTPHPDMPGIGVELKQMKCDSPNCGHTTSRIHDPNGMLKG